MRLIASVFAFALWSGVAAAEVIHYEVYEVSSIGSKLITKGSRTYSIANVKVFPLIMNGRNISEKFVDLESGFRIGARIFSEPRLTGFGLLAGRTERDFSREKGDQFRKLQGGTTVTVAVYGRPFFEELAEVRFEEDTTLRFTSERRGLDDTHHVIVKAGSVLRFR